MDRIINMAKDKKHHGGEHKDKEKNDFWLVSFFLYLGDFLLIGKFLKNRKLFKIF
jgi:hypothetical protein